MTDHCGSLWTIPSHLMVGHGARERVDQRVAALLIHYLLHTAYYVTTYYLAHVSGYTRVLRRVHITSWASKGNPLATWGDNQGTWARVYCSLHKQGTWGGGFCVLLTTHCLLV